MPRRRTARKVIATKHKSIGLANFFTGTVRIVHVNVIISSQLVIYDICVSTWTSGNRITLKIPIKEKSCMCVVAAVPKIDSQFGTPNPLLSDL
jgi:hypothetical protein